MEPLAVCGEAGSRRSAACAAQAESLALTPESASTASRIAGTGHRRRRHHSGTAADHVGRYRLLAERGVSTVFVSLPGLAGPDDVLRLAPVTAAFR